MSEKSVIYAADMTKIEQVYNGKVLPLSSYNPTAIHNISESPDNGIAPSSKVNVQSSKLFDLSGRRLDSSKFLKGQASLRAERKVQSSKVNGQSSKLPKGIYIQNGRKILVK